MRYFILLFFLFLLCPCFAEEIPQQDQAKAILNVLKNKVETKNTEIISLVNKYHKAKDSEKEKIKKQIKTLLAKEEDNLIIIETNRVKRQENRLKEVKKNLEQHKKNKDKIVQNKLDDLLKDNQKQETEQDKKQEQKQTKKEEDKK